MGKSRDVLVSRNTPGSEGAIRTERARRSPVQRSGKLMELPFAFLPRA
jgi:hypothetical protein